MQFGQLVLSTTRISPTSTSLPYYCRTLDESINKLGVVNRGVGVKHGRRDSGNDFRVPKIASVPVVFQFFSFLLCRFWSGRYQTKKHILNVFQQVKYLHTLLNILLHILLHILLLWMYICFYNTSSVLKVAMELRTHTQKQNFECFLLPKILYIMEGRASQDLLKFLKLVLIFQVIQGGALTEVYGYRPDGKGESTSGKQLPSIFRDNALQHHCSVR